MVPALFQPVVAAYMADHGLKMINGKTDLPVVGRIGANDRHGYMASPSTPDMSTGQSVLEK